MMARILLLLLSTAIVSPVFCADPWDEHGKFQMEIDYGSCDGWGTAIANIPEHYIKRFGEFPDFMLWEGESDTVWFVADCGFLRYSNADPDLDPPAPAWSMDLTWKDVKRYFYWRTESVKTGNIVFLPVTQCDDTTKVIDEGFHANGDWFVHFDFDLKTLAIPKDGSAWKVNLQIYQKSPDDGIPPLISSDTFVVVRSKIETPTDSLMWAKDKNILHKDIDLCRQLLRHFPNSRTMIRNMMHFYTEDVNCDSLKFYGQRYIDVYKARSDPHYVKYDFSGEVHDKPRPISNADYNFVQNHLWQVCGDTLDIIREVPPIEEEYNRYKIER